jgi:hypothetical protein
MLSFQQDSVSVMRDAEDLPLRRHPADSRYVLVPVRWNRDGHGWCQSPGWLVRAGQNLWLAGFALGAAFAEVVRTTHASGDSAVATGWPTFTEVAENTAAARLPQPCFFRVPDPDTFGSPGAEVILLGVVVRRTSAMDNAQFGGEVLDALCRVLGVCVSMQDELASRSDPGGARKARWRRLHSTVRSRDDVLFAPVGRHLDDVPGLVSSREGPPSVPIPRLGTG